MVAEEMEVVGAMHLLEPRVILLPLEAGWSAARMKSEMVDMVDKGAKTPLAGGQKDMVAVVVDQPDLRV